MYRSQSQSQSLCGFVRQYITKRAFDLIIIGVLLVLAFRLLAHNWL
jgi:hypothetical protein